MTKLYSWFYAVKRADNYLLTVGKRILNMRVTVRARIKNALLSD